MTSSKSTLWMGNIENWMSQSQLVDLLKSVNIYPNKITIKNYTNKRGCAFLEFFSPEMAQHVLTEYNNKIVNGVTLKFNKVHCLEQKYNSSKITKFTVSRVYYIYLFNKQLFVGNIDKSISFEEVKNYFYSRFNSIISAKLITNQQTGRSKGYAFIEFTCYKEFVVALNIKEPLIFGKQKLVLNSAKNRFDYDDEEKTNELGNMNCKEEKERKSLDSLNSNSQNHGLSSTESGISSIRNSKESSNSNGNNNPFLENKSKAENNSLDLNDETNDLQLLIKDSLKKISEQYYMSQSNNSSLYNYYCTPFLYNNYNMSNYFFGNIKYENENSENIRDIIRNCSFEFMENK